MADAQLIDAPLVRRHQLDGARGWVAELTDGKGRAVLIEGEPGIGKSALIRAAATEATLAGCQVLWATCDELSQAFPLLPLTDALDEYAIQRGARDSGIGELLRTTATPGTGVDPVAAASERILALVDEYCVSSPVMLVVDDMQWADPATVVTIGRLARSVRQLPLLLVCIARPVPRRDDLVALRRALDPDGLVALHSLSESEVAELVTTVVGGTPGDQLLRLAAEAGGNPLYLTELVEALMRGHSLVINDGHVEAVGGQTPHSLAAAIADRLEFLSPPVRDVLRVAALLGLDFSVKDLSIVSGRRMTDLLPVLDEAILAGVVVDNGSELAFRHPLIRVALYEGMPTAVRTAWHTDAARSLAEQGAPAERVARQLLPTVDADNSSEPVDEWMVGWLAKVSQQLVSQAPNVAIPLLRRAVAGVPAGQRPHDLLACRLADALYKVGDPGGAADVARRTLLQVNQPDLVVDLHWTLVQCFAAEGKSDESLEALDKALRRSDIGPRERARLHVLKARTHRNIGRLDAAADTADVALAAARAVGDSWATGWALAVLTIVHGMRGEPSKALPLFEQAFAVTEGDPALADLRLMLQLNQAAALGDLDRSEDAIRAAAQVRQMADDLGNVLRLEQAQSVLGELLFDTGRWDDALTEVDLASGSKNPSVECAHHGIAAAIQLHRGDTSAARHLMDAERFATRIGGRFVPALSLAKSLDREQAEEPEEALAVLMEQVSESEDVGPAADLLPDAARLAVTVGDSEAARTIVSRAEAVTKTTHVPHRKIVEPHCRGLIEKDPMQLLKAAEGYQSVGRPLPRAQALEAASVALADQGDIAGARTHFTEAFSVYSQLGAGWDLARTQAALRAYGIRRGPHVRHRRSREGWNSLTPTELKVVGLVARGMSNPQIATLLFLSRRTVQSHVSHILAKLNLNSRIDIAREASHRDLTEVSA